MKNGNKDVIKRQIMKILNSDPKVAEDVLAEIVREKECPFYDICGQKYLEEHEPIELYK